jgi:nucleotide-binding universal stress UspA family protein
VQVEDEGAAISPGFSRILVALDGSGYSERVLPYARLLAKAFGSRVTLLCVPAVPEAQSYRAAADIRLKIREKAEANMLKFLEATARPLRRGGLQVDVRVTGSIPARSILAVAREEKSDLVMLTSQGRGGYNAMLLGKVAEEVVEGADCPVFMLPIQGEAPAPQRVGGLIRSEAPG